MRAHAFSTATVVSEKQSRQSVLAHVPQSWGAGGIELRWVLLEFLVFPC